MSTPDGPPPLDPTIAVLSHALISSAAVITSALQSLLAFGDDLPVERRADILQMALTQAEYLGEVLKDLARGLPGEVIDALDDLSHRRPASRS